MKMMSWSRYRCLSWSFMRAHLRGGVGKRRMLKPAALWRHLEPRLSRPLEMRSCAAEGRNDAIPPDDNFRTKAPRSGTDI